MDMARAFCMGGRWRPRRILWLTRHCYERCWLQLEQWEGFDIFEVARLSRGRPLQTVALAALQHFGLVEKLGLPPAKLSAFLQACSPGSRRLERHLLAYAPCAQGDRCSRLLPALGFAPPRLQLVSTCCNLS